MLNLRKTAGKTSINITTEHTPIEQLLEKEWLLTNGRGGYSSSSIVGCNTSRYHGLLVGSFEYPANRIMALSTCLETIFWGSAKFDLSTFEFPSGTNPNGYLRMKSFSRGLGAHFHYELGEVKLTKSIYMLREQNTVAIVYEFTDVDEHLTFAIRPLVAMRDFHAIQKSTPNINCEQVEEGIVFRHQTPEFGNLLLSCPGSIFENDPQWWYNFVYRQSKERGQEHSEDLFTPGFFKYHIDAPETIVLWADLTKVYKSGHFIGPDIEYVVGQLNDYQNKIIAPAKDDEKLGKLYLAADQFVVKNVTHPQKRTTIFAGYHWFADWGRDSGISLPGILLATGRFEEAKSVLLNFAHAAKEGVIPNRFDDYANVAHFNSVDASLWFVNAAFAYLKASGDKQTFGGEFLQTIISIINSYQHGNSYGIKADKDGLITAGDAQTQLTWMDAKFDKTVFTPRYGKPVEVNALWYNAIMLLSEYLGQNGGDFANLLPTLRERAEKVRSSFNKLFWNEKWGWLNDCILPDGAADASLRPNQIFAVSLPYSPIDFPKQKAVVDVVEKKLLTPYGLRTLSPDDKRYEPRYTGPQFNRDKAYHQGTVWPYLTGAFVEAYLKVRPKRKKEARPFIESLLKNIDEDGCIGQVSEIFDAESPQRPRGCLAQAWSVAELIRAYMMIKE